jgi:acyl-CoA oxidase
MTMGALKTVIYSTVKYSQQRKGVSPNGKSETPIFDYQLQQNALIPLIARTLGLNMLHNYAKSIYEHPKGHEEYLLLTCCCDKAIVSWHAERTISQMRERTGGQGYLGANMYGEAIAGAHAAMTAEGDNRVLMIKVVKDLLSISMKKPDFFYSGEFIKLSDKNELYCLKTMNVLFQMLEKFKLERLINKMTTLKVNGKSNYAILMLETSDEVQELALAHGEKIAIQSCLSSLEKLTTSKEIVRNYFLLFAWEVILRELALFVLQGWITPELAGSLKENYNELIKKAAKDIDVIVNSLNIPVHALKIPIAKDYIKYNSYANYGEVVNAKL